MQQQTDYMMSQTAIRLAEGSGGAKAVFYLSNHRGDTLATCRGDSSLVAKYRYDAFGNQRTASCVVSEPENAPRYTFSTKEYLSDAGLYLYQYRVYDPIAGRWTQRDPIDYQDSINLYQFCGNNPLNMIDVWGLKLFGVFVHGHSANPFGHALIKHVDDNTGVVTYYDVNVKLDKDGNIMTDRNGDYLFECQTYTQEEFDKKYGNATTKKEAQVDDITDEKAVLKYLQDHTGKAYPYDKFDNNCVTYANNALVKGGHTVTTDGSYFENPYRYPSDWVDGIEKQNSDRRVSGGSH